MNGTYHQLLVALSFAVATLASYTALTLAGRVSGTRGNFAKLWLIGGAVAMGTGIWSMHFIGMLAFHLPIAVSYDLAWTLASWVIAMLVSGFALHLVSGRTLERRRLLLGGILMGFGIAAMHYAGMAALEVMPGISYDPVLLFASIMIAIVAATAALWIAFRLRHGNSRLVFIARIGASLVMACAITGMHYTGMAAARFAPDTICITPNGLGNTWLALAVAGFTICVLTTTLLLSFVDARMRRRTGNLVASLKQASSELEYLATHDSLTRLPNRLLLIDRIAQAIAHSERTGIPCALLFVDLDRFKTINDSLGHQVGDRLLVAVASRLRDLLRAEDTVARLGGDEFVVVLPEIKTPAAAAKVAEKAIATLATPTIVTPHELHVTPSVGISVFPADGRTPDELLANADAAMYHAKKNGRNSYQFFAPEMNTFNRERIELENDLRRALTNDEFELHYQPKVDIRTGRIVSVEALVRWRHPERGLVPPVQFIPLAEEIGLIIPLGKWVLDTACRQARAWQHDGLPPLRMAVNLSASQFQQRDLVQMVTATLRDADLEPRYLELELTESTVMSNPQDATMVLRDLSDFGVHISIDDFGTGYSSLSYLKRLPLDKLKIDRSFVSEIDSNAEDLAIVRSIVSLAHSLRLKVIAEGVETAAQLDHLRALDCDQYQGYYCSPPVPAVQLSALLHTSKAIAKAV